MKSKSLLLMLMNMVFVLTLFSQGAPDIFVGPFSHWLNVKTNYGATGNGSTDDAPAIQAAFNAIQATQGEKTLYFPAGTYRINNTLTMKGAKNLRIVGVHPDSVKIIWGGASNGNMIYFNGVALARFERITLDGNNKNAGRGLHVGIDYTPGTFFPTAWGIYDVKFINIKTGAYLGQPNCQAEASYDRCTFKNCDKGIWMVDANTADIWVRYSVFEDCGYGITGFAHATVLNSIFRRSTIMDIGDNNMGYYGVRHCYSIGSKTFYENGDNLDGRNAILEGNTIIDYTGQYAMNLTGAGPFTVFDNVIRSRDGATAPVINRGTTNNTYGLFVGNTFTIGTPETAIRTTATPGATGRIIDNFIVNKNSIDITEPVLPKTPQRIPATATNVFQPTAFTGTAIQNAINAAVAAYPKTLSIVYLKQGEYNVSNTIVVPKGSPVYILGDVSNFGGTVTLKWTSSSTLPMFRFEGPGNRGTLHSVFIQGQGNCAGILIEDADQHNGRVYVDRLIGAANESPTPEVGVWLDQLDWTKLESYNGYGMAAGKTSIRVIGGPLSQSGSTTTAGFIAWNSAVNLGLSENLSAVEVKNNGKLMVADSWIESGGWPYRQPLFKLDSTHSGTITFQGYKLQHHGDGVGLTNSMEMNGFSGKLSVFNINLQNFIVDIKGNNPAQNIFMATNSFMYGDPNSNPLPKEQCNSKITYTATAGNTAVINCAQSCPDFNTFCQYQHTYPYQYPIGNPTDQWIRDMMAQAREHHPSFQINPLDTGITDVRIMWVQTTKVVGYQLKISTGPSAPSNVPVTAISLSPKTISLPIGSTQQITATVLPSNASNKNVNWSSSNASIATVSNGMVTGVTVGSVNIIATTVDGAKKDTCYVIVTGSYENILYNPGFEYDFATWQVQNASIITSTVNSGSKAAQLSGNNAGVYQTISGLKPNTTYLLSVYGRRADSNQELILYVKNFGGTEKNINITSTSYSKVTIEFTTGSTNTSAEIGVWKYAGTGIGFCDDFSLSEKLPDQISVFTTQIPTATDNDNDYELGMKFRSTQAGQITKIRYYKPSGETGSHTGRIWSATGTQLASVVFTDETASGWQEATLATPLTISANTTYVVSVNANSVYAITLNGLQTSISNGYLSSVADGANGVFNETIGQFPTQSWNNSNYFRDVVFVLNIITEINKTSEIEEIKIYPNPTTGKINVMAQENSTIDVLDITGRVVYSTTTVGSHTVIDLQVGKGVYFVKINNEKVKKLIVQ